MFCIKCGNKLEPGAAFCPHCGARAEGSSAPAFGARLPAFFLVRRSRLAVFAVVLAVAVVLLGIGIRSCTRAHSLVGTWKSDISLYSVTFSRDGTVYGTLAGYSLSRTTKIEYSTSGKTLTITPSADPGYHISFVYEITHRSGKDVLKVSTVSGDISITYYRQ